MEQQCVCQTENMTEEDAYNTLHQVIVDYDRQPGNLIQKLHMAQAIFGYFSEPVQHFICKEMDLSVSEVSGVASFYSYFTTQPRGRYNIQVCLGTACYVRGGKKVLEGIKETLNIEVGETTKDRRFSLEVKRCIGACGLAPAVMIDGTVHKRVNPNKLQDILCQYK